MMKHFFSSFKNGRSFLETREKILGATQYPRNKHYFFVAFRALTKTRKPTLVVHQSFFFFPEPSGPGSSGTIADKIVKNPAKVIYFPLCVVIGLCCEQVYL
jgi:hypothetical protein